jgi:hypothetical protein
LFSRVFNHVARRSGPKNNRRAAALTFRDRAICRAWCPARKWREPRDRPMTFASRLSVITAYVVIAFVGAIVLGVF